MSEPLFSQTLAPSSSARFNAPNWKVSLDVEARIAQVPPKASVKGMFWHDLQKAAATTPGLLPATKYAAFSDYPLTDYMRAVAKVARATSPGTMTAEGIRRVGQRSFDVFSSSLTGKVLFAFAGRDLTAAFGLVSEAYRRCLTPGDARIVNPEPGRAIIELRNVWNFVESFQVGVFEGAIDHFGHTGSVKLQVHSMCDADYLIEWH